MRIAAPAIFAVLLFFTACGLALVHPFGIPRSAPHEPDGSAAPESGDLQRGKDIFERKCTGCHAIDADRDGPHLRGVYGRMAGSAPGFGYSGALKNSGIVWDELSLDRWLHDTDAAVPGNAMNFSVPKSRDRADLIAFLRSLR